MASTAAVVDWVIAHEVVVRFACFAAVFALIGAWEACRPARARKLSRLLRWTNNLGLVALGTVLLRVLFPAAAAGMAAVAAAQGWGLLHYAAPPFWLAVLVSVIVLDFVIWLQHVMVHAIPLLWRLHRVHHADPDYDLTTGARFHPLEILLSMLIKFAAIVLLGPPVVAVILFEVLLNATAMFNHANARLPARLDRLLRWFVVTPDMHRVHHSVEDDETNTNFGFNLPWWDRLCGTYRDQPRAGHVAMRIGIHGFDDPRDVTWLPGLLTLPLRGRISGYAINRRRWTDTEDAPR
ncbi:MAG: sterol desaturase family protein [Gammaproteobacteria bacterium]